ncbi:endonuclease III [Tundrisphaera lichenicola]|uniref:endonuclease III n=1 Tax=Tundrisphaera lichenicola TaxID=2029860 RepID=UPI003EB89F20
MPPKRGPSSDPRTQARQVVRALNRLYPTVRCELNHRNPFELLVATVLSAQCTDERVNQVTPALFVSFPGPGSLAAADLADVEALVYRTGFFRNKARNLIALSSKLVECHGGEVPPDFDALTSLPGVGRKTAHVVMGNAFKIPSGVVVDTHVKRLAYRLGLTKQTNPEVIERELESIVPKKEWIDLSHRLIAHGRGPCDALRPRCDLCELRELCPRNGLIPDSRTVICS